MRCPPALALLIPALVCLPVDSAIAQQAPEVSGDADRFAELVAEWLGSPGTDDALRDRAVAAVLDAGRPALDWFGDQLRQAGVDAPIGEVGSQEGHDAVDGERGADGRGKALALLAREVVLGFVQRQRDSGIVHRGQYEPLAALQPFVGHALFRWLLQTPDWFPDTDRVNLVPVLADLQPEAPRPALLLGVTDLIEAVESEPGDLRMQLACLVWQWGRKSYVEERAARLRADSAEGDAQDRIVALRQLADLWYRVRDYAAAARTHSVMEAMATAAKIELAPVDWYWGACYFALSGDVDKGFAALRRCADLQASPGVDSSRKLPRKLFEKDPEIAALRADDRFAAVLERAFPAGGDGPEGR